MLETASQIQQAASLVQYAALAVVISMLAGFLVTASKGVLISK